MIPLEVFTDVTLDADDRDEDEDEYEDLVMQVIQS